MEKQSLAGKKIIVTGGSSGYGYGIAGALKAGGAEVIIIGRRPEALTQAAAELGVQAQVCDVTRPEDWDRVFAGLDKLDILINNAGAGIRIADLTAQSDAEITASIATNLLGVLYGCRRAAMLMKTQKSGLIVNVSSICSHYGWPGFVPYTAAKAGVDMASRALYTELRPYNIRVTVVTPSWGDTNFGVAAHLDSAEVQLRKQMMSPAQMGDLMVNICETPAHLVYPEIMIQPMVQEIIPF